MNKIYRFEIPAGTGMIRSNGYDVLEDCIEICKMLCERLNIGYSSPNVKLFLSEDSGETWTECTEEGEIAG